MMFRYAHAAGTWVDLEQPTAEEVRAIAQEFGLSERLEAELLSPTPLPLVAGDSGVALLVLHFPVHAGDGTDARNQEVDFIVGRRFVATVRYEVIAPLHELRKLLEANEAVVGRTTITPDVLLEILFAHLYAAVRDQVNHAATHLELIERQMFSGRERQSVRAISNIGREFLHLESAVANQEGPLGRFLRTLEGRGFFGPSFAERIGRIHAEREQVARLIATHRAVATELRETNKALLEARQNEVMKTLTVITVIMLPLSLFAETFAMQVRGLPLQETPHGFAIVLGFMALIAVALTSVFAWRRWLF